MTQRAIDLFLTIEKPDKIIFSILFNACAQLRTKDALDLGKKVFNQLPIECRQSNDLLYSVLNMFIKCDDLKSAESLFNRIDRDLISYGSMMKFYNMKEQPEQTLTLFEQMKQNKIKPNKIIFVLLIDACSVIGDLSLCQSLISQIPPSFLTDPWIQVGLVDMWVRLILTLINN
ncbi:unnamed protein product [Rotaria sp. Silwood1]|nr:unnamed protein product [Rotaria sp. Silwood1]CAF3687252.1 unnamed protein product [Rotaria sp. Silwood1]